jgi:hypothetical protein
LSIKTFATVLHGHCGKARTISIKHSYEIGEKSLKQHFEDNMTIRTVNTL